MPKDTYYFPHDYNARNDRKLVRVKMQHRMSGIGIYWCIVEMLYEEDGKILMSEVPTIAAELKAKEVTVLSVLNDFDLFKNDGIYFWSDSVNHRLGKRYEKSEKAKESANERWRKATAMRTQSECNAIKERKGKERKEKKSKGEERRENARAPHLFFDSVFFVKKVLQEKLIGTPYETANVDWYHERLNNWSNSNNEKKLDWLATAKNWMANDMKDGKFIDKNFKPPQNGKSNPRGSDKPTHQSVNDAFNEFHKSKTTT